MIYLRRTVIWLSGWIDDAAAAALLIIPRFRATRRFRFVEQSNGNFLIEPLSRRFSTQTTGAIASIVDARVVGALTAELHDLLAGAAIDVVLLPRRFMFRPLDLPSRAAEFLDAVVRSQIDRLTPWSADEAAFGWSAAEVANGRLNLTIAATARSLVRSDHRCDLRSASGFDRSLYNEGEARSAGQPEKIDVFNQRPAQEHGLRRVRRWLLIMRIGSGICCLCRNSLTWFIVGGNLDSETDCALSPPRRTPSRNKQWASGSRRRRHRISRAQKAAKILPARHSSGKSVSDPPR